MGVRSWNELNDILRNASEKLCKKMLSEELRGGKRKQFVMRIYSRYNRMRADRERKELKAKL